MSVNNQVRKMLQLQSNVNATIAADWFSFNRPWYRAVWLEAAEAIEHNGWKWWKKLPEGALPKVQMELVDIWHFMLSDVLQNEYRQSEFAARAVNQPFQITNPEEFALVLSRAEELICDCWDWYAHNESNLEEFYAGKDLNAVIELVAISISSERAFIHNPVDFDTAMSDFLDDDNQEVLDNPVTYSYLGTFFRALKEADLTIDSLTEQYIGKNCLNTFRQENGYKEGTYRKTWMLDGTGVEDSSALTSIINANPYATGTDPAVYIEVIKTELTSAYGAGAPPAPVDVEEGATEPNYIIYVGEYELNQFFNNISAMSDHASVVDCPVVYVLCEGEVFPDSVNKDDLSRNMSVITVPETCPTTALEADTIRQHVIQAIVNGSIKIN